MLIIPGAFAMWDNPLIETASMPALDVDFGAYERFVLRTMLRTFIRGKVRDGRLRVTEEFMRWYERFSDDIGVRVASLDAACRAAEREKGNADGGRYRISRAELNRGAGPAPARSALQKRLDWVADTLGLEAREAACLGAVCRLTQVEPFRALVAAMRGQDCQSDEVSASAVGSLLGLGGSELRRVFDQRSPLLQFGLVVDRHGGDYALSELLLKLLRLRTTDPERLEDALIGEPVEPSLALSDFDHMGSAREDVVAILKGALAEASEGVAMLFYGPPGTGKTEFAALLSDACDARIVFAGEMDEDQREPTRADRLAHLALLSAIGERAGRVIVVVDEADDIFTGVDEDDFSNRTGSKVFVNRLVERCAVPTIWITNHPARLGSAVLRRMLRAVEFRKPGRQVRRRIVDRHSAALELDVDAASRERLASLDASPAVIASSLRAASLGAGGGAMAVSTAASIQRALGERDSLPALHAVLPFDAALSSADVDLAEIERRVVEAGPGALSFLFSGIPGTGKTAFARHLAERLGMEVLQKRASDLLGMYVGQSEANIAEAFRQALEGRMFLVFDEADSLLLDRRGAQRSWEISQVNEMLTWMETHPLPFAATSNLLERLDPAVQRRFLFKVRFAPMSPAQIALAFRGSFGCEAPAAALRLDPVTPGDFAVVARKAAVLRLDDADALAALLAAEVAVKPGARNAIGFV